LSSAESPPPDVQCNPPLAHVGLWWLACAAVAAAFVVRWPYVAESLWVDELHSAWSVWGDFREVAHRAAWGNQTPVYYWGLWLWRQVAGDGEVALRTSSVLLSSIACGTLAAGVARCSQSFVGGFAAAVMLACDPNAIFFGTELRVFPAVMLLAVVACWSWQEQFRSGNLRAAIVLYAAVICAALVQPTSLGVLGWLCLSGRSAAGRIAWLKQSGVSLRKRNLILIGLLVTGLALLGWWLAGRVLLTAWQHRDQWAAFAAADSPWQLWTIWRWTPLLLIPAVVASGLLLVDRFRGQPALATSGQWWRPALVALLATLFFWLISACGIVAVFHRRYLIAALPILVWAGAAAIGEASNRVQRLCGGQSRWAPLRWTPGLIALLLGGLLVHARLREAQQRPRLRGEDWRGAAAYVSAHRVGSEPVLLDPGLIETRRLLASGDPEALKYLAYPLSGPYNLQPVTVVNLRQPPQGDAPVAAGATRLAVLRCSRRSAQMWAERVAGSAPGAFAVESFGGVQVVWLGVVTEGR